MEIEVQDSTAITNTLHTEEEVKRGNAVKPLVSSFVQIEANQLSIAGLTIDPEKDPLAMDVSTSLDVPITPICVPPDIEGKEATPASHLAEVQQEIDYGKQIDGLLGKQLDRMLRFSQWSRVS